jgi:hypothetical protein
MNEEIGRQLAEQPQSNKWEPPTPLGYSLPVLLQLRQIDLTKEVLRVLPAIFGGKLPPPIPPEPRPQTAAQRIRDAIETRNVLDALTQLGIDF